MGVPCLKPLPLYRPRDPQALDLRRLLDEHFETFREVYSKRFQDKYGFWRPVLDRSVWNRLRRASCTTANPCVLEDCGQIMQNMPSLRILPKWQGKKSLLCLIVLAGPIWYVGELKLALFF